MNPQNQRPSAQILQFPPVGARARIAAQRQEKWKMKPSEIQIPPAVFGAAWYHEAAIAEKDSGKIS